MLENLKSLYRALLDVEKPPQLSEADLDMLQAVGEEREFLATLPKEVLLRLRHVAHLYGLEEEMLQADPPHFRELVTICGTCSMRGLCSARLRRGDLQDMSDAQFCPNQHTYTEMTLDRDI